MHLISLAITDVRSIAKMTLDFSSDKPTARRWTLLLGENGCGKSTVLRCIALVLAGGDGLADLLSDPDAWIRHGRPSCKISATIEFEPGRHLDISLEMRRGDTLSEILDRNRESLVQFDQSLKQNSESAVALGYGVSRRLPVAGRRVTGLSRLTRSPRAGAFATMFLPEFPLISLEDWAIDLHYRKGAKGLSAIRDSLNTLLPGMEFARIDRVRGKLMFRTTDGPIALSELSDGYQSMAAWFGDLLFRITQTLPHAINPLMASGLLLIDELDLHLHPLWQRRLVQFLDKTLPNFQIIATTHSPQTAQQSSEGDLYVIRRHARTNAPELIPFVGEPKTMLLHQLIMSPMFGIDSMDSLEVEKKRAAARRLELTDSRTANQEKRLRNLATELSSLPEWTVSKDELVKLGVLTDTRRKTGQASHSPKPVISPTHLRAMRRRLEAKGDSMQGIVGRAPTEQRATERPSRASTPKKRRSAKA
ncbi:recombination protein F [Caballeronia fortuita]|uniref:Recombination protein F n=1 Tax=Caballeronia fortuita TaxID=1777138 RepID=A0A158CUD7_9BURK|nr:AAA family ATPase [Caballeronia fortuita]SAK85992.1 recombination protein F [Caballeronia fortuita]